MSEVLCDPDAESADLPATTQTAIAPTSEVDATSPSQIAAPGVSGGVLDDDVPKSTSKSAGIVPGGDTSGTVGVASGTPRTRGSVMVRKNTCKNMQASQNKQHFSI